MDYQTPLLLQRLMKWEQEYAPQVKYLEKPSGLFLGMNINDKEGYYCTPIDSFPFAYTGGDGVHYALLTDFGLNKDLNEAPVIRVLPMDLEVVRLVSRNIKDFFSLYFFDVLLMLNEYRSEEAYFESIREQESTDLKSEWFDFDRWKRENAMVVRQVQEKFNLSPIPNAFQYIQDIRKERQLKTAISTEDSLGILSLTPSIPSEKEEQFALIRNLQFSACYDRDVLERHAKKLIQWGLRNEAEALLTRL